MRGEATEHTRGGGSQSRGGEEDRGVCRKKQEGVIRKRPSRHLLRDGGSSNFERFFFFEIAILKDFVSYDLLIMLI